MNWGKFPNFKQSEFLCSHCQTEQMSELFLTRLQILRSTYKKSMTVTSGYRCKAHPIEARKTEAGPHTTGHAADILIRGHEAYELLSLAIHLGFTGIGINQKGDGRFLHLDDLPSGDGRLRPTIWSY